MAIDTRHKRFNMLYFASPVVWCPHFEADNTVDADDRAQLLHLFGGNALNNPAPGNDAELLSIQLANLRGGLNVGGMLT